MSKEKSVDLPGETLATLESERLDPPFKSPVQPVELTLDSTIQFHCHKGMTCFNVCCRSADITLTPYDILRLKNHFGMSAPEFVTRYTIPFEMDSHGMPGLKLAAKPGTRECLFVNKKGCSVYQDRPLACRYYALGNMGVRKKDTAKVEDIYFLVKESHCLGHIEPRNLTVREYRKEQGIEPYDKMNREWRDIVIKKRSSGPTIGQPTKRSLLLFDMCSYDIDSFREFIQTDGFKDTCDVDQETMERLKADEEELLKFAFRFLKQVLFGEMTITVKKDAEERHLLRRQEINSSTPE